MKTKRLVHKPTGIWFWMQFKRAFNTAYYSANAGATWHKSKLRAFDYATETKSLDIAIQSRACPEPAQASQSDPLEAWHIADGLENEIEHQRQIITRALAELGAGRQDKAREILAELNPTQERKGN